MSKLTKTPILFLSVLMCQSVDGQTIKNPDLPENAPAHMTLGKGATPEPVKILSVSGSQPLKVYTLPFEDVYPTGPFEKLDNNQYLFISKCGDVYFAKLEDKFNLIKPAEQLTKPPMAEGNVINQEQPTKLVYCKGSSGVKDSLLLNNSLFVAYITWDKEFNGAKLAVSEFEFDAVSLGLVFKREIFLSNPAVKEPFLGLQAGGKLAIGENDHTLYVSIGDFSRPEKVQVKTTSLGKVIKINLKSLNAQVFATGIRSPSGGLMFDRSSNELWLTDHGPKGGDELNLIKHNKNYGWPAVSYGTIYERDGMGSYYGNKFNNHEGYEKPSMTFVPSIGIGPIAKYPLTGKNDYWDNDYFIAGMGSGTLLRVRKEGTKLVYAEPVLTGYRIRALKIDKHGNFYMKTDYNQFLVSE